MIIKDKKSTEVLAALITVCFYLWNASDLADCDFKEPYRCEVVHSMGVVVPSASFVTVWFEVDE